MKRTPKSKLQTLAAEKENPRAARNATIALQNRSISVCMWSNNNSNISTRIQERQETRQLHCKNQRDKIWIVCVKMWQRTTESWIERTGLVERRESAVLLYVWRCGSAPPRAELRGQDWWSGERVRLYCVCEDVVGEFRMWENVHAALF